MGPISKSGAAAAIEAKATVRRVVNCMVVEVQSGIVELFR